MMDVISSKSKILFESETTLIFYSHPYINCYLIETTVVFGMIMLLKFKANAFEGVIYITLVYGNMKLPWAE